MRIEKYKNEYKQMWDHFVRNSKNGNFHLERGFIDHHKEKFEDYSLLIWDDNDKLVSVFPANRDDNNLYSHAGLTYGGFILCYEMKIYKMFDLFKACFSYLKERNIKMLYYKTIPYIYYKAPSEEDKYFLYLCNARLASRNILLAINLKNRLKYRKGRIGAIKKAQKNQLFVKESNDLKSYWEILIELLELYNSKPVHTLEEMEYLKSEFPGNIKLYGCYQNTTLLAGVLVFESEIVVRTQYIASNATGKNLGAVDLILSNLIEEYSQDKNYFDFGASTANNGYYINVSLSNQKEGFGAMSVVHDQYEVNISEWNVSLIDRALTKSNI